MKGCVFMSEKRLWYIVKGYDFGDVDNDIRTAFGSVYCTVANHAFNAIQQVNAFLRRNPGREPNPSMKGTTSMHEEAFLRPVGNQAPSAAQADGVYVYDENILLYNSESERHAWRAATRDVRVKPQRPVVSFNDAVDQFIRYPDRFKTMPDTDIVIMKAGAVEKSRRNIQGELQRFTGPQYPAFIRSLQGKPFSEADEEFIGKLPENDKKVLMADIALSELKPFTFMGVTRSFMCLQDGNVVFDEAFPDSKDKLNELRKDMSLDESEGSEVEGFDGLG